MDHWLKLAYGWEHDKAQPLRAVRSIPPRDPYVACAIGDEPMLERMLGLDGTAWLWRKCGRYPVLCVTQSARSRGRLGGLCQSRRNTELRWLKSTTFW